ncbi:hypothetical protein [Adhaeribacter rhizoryzae]|uniref:Uncharacterized protein n=1 Tax=Adhaeribacter rhizoryzae TaxID=2607907 RepID=A0A5M6D2L7_9BACT|nr:hypothetical protein [Adhaeribacter rhizoryzae]KAA5540840.1 hypothetical protein F0145_22310 [Adhaeribacter rhizoryzae]
MSVKIFDNFEDLSQDIQQNCKGSNEILIGKTIFDKRNVGGYSEVFLRIKGSNRRYDTKMYEVNGNLRNEIFTALNVKDTESPYKGEFTASKFKL